MFGGSGGEGADGSIPLVSVRDDGCVDPESGGPGGSVAKGRLLAHHPHQALGRGLCQLQDRLSQQPLLRMGFDKRGEVRDRHAGHNSGLGDWFRHRLRRSPFGVTPEAQAISREVLVRVISREQAGVALASSPV
jgi:hypothetical protein